MVTCPLSSQTASWQSPYFCEFAGPATNFSVHWPPSHFAACGHWPPLEGAGHSSSFVHPPAPLLDDPLAPVPPVPPAPPLDGEADAVEPPVPPPAPPLLGVKGSPEQPG